MAKSIFEGSTLRVRARALTYVQRLVLPVVLTR